MIWISVKSRHCVPTFTLLWILANVVLCCGDGVFKKMDAHLELSVSVTCSAVNCRSMIETSVYNVNSTCCSIIARDKTAIPNPCFICQCPADPSIRHDTFLSLMIYHRRGARFDKSSAFKAWLCMGHVLCRFCYCAMCSTVILFRVMFHLCHFSVRCVTIPYWSISERYWLCLGTKMYFQIGKLFFHIAFNVRTVCIV